MNIYCDCRNEHLEGIETH